MSKKLAFVIFLVLLGVIVFEAMFYFKLGGFRQMPALVPPSNNSPIKERNVPPIGEVKQGIEINQAVNENAIEYLRKNRVHILTRSIVTNEYRGKITELNLNGGSFHFWRYNTDVPYKYGIVIEGDQPEAGGTVLPANSFYVMENQLSSFQVSRADGTAATVADLKKGDEIVIKEIIDILKDPYEGRQSLMIVIQGAQ